ncbi:hypothetical protein V9T40_010537 [Parthenolecanium corni]|uniref:Uncharacterized protein n=1 Tax=Parthenolecanium corni TaxID=536013 RepID=A0AAN9TI69_9HEMI
MQPAKILFTDDSVRQGERFSLRCNLFIWLLKRRNNAAISDCTNPAEILVAASSAKNIISRAMRFSLRRNVFISPLNRRHNAAISDCTNPAEILVAASSAKNIISRAMRRLNFRPAVSFFGQLSQFSPRCRNFLRDVTIFGWMSQFSAGCLIFPAVEN